jgi:nucleoside-diphosphate-sugar epimerase
MRLLVLGGSGFVGRAVAQEAVARGHEVTVFNRGRRAAVAGVRTMVGDRQDPVALRGDETWDAVVDTWSADAAVVELSARLLKGRAGHYAYVSSRSVYEWGTPSPLTEDSPLLDPAEEGYGGDKLRGELAAGAFGGPVLLARAGLILGPHEDVGRLPWWLRRLRRGGPTLAPGPSEAAVQYVDARDLAVLLIDAALNGREGPVNVVCEPGHTTMGELLTVAAEVTGGRAELRWTDPAVIEAAGVQPWTQLPIWLPPGPDHDFMTRADVSRALAFGLRCRPVRETVADTWAWLAPLAEAPRRADRDPVGLDPAVEAELLGR